MTQMKKMRTHRLQHRRDPGRFEFDTMASVTYLPEPRTGETRGS